MFCQEYITKMKEAQCTLLNYLDKEDDIEENYQNFINIIKNHKLLDDRYEIQSILYLISRISNNHYRHPNFISKIEKLFQYLNNYIKNYIPNAKLFNIFKMNKLILLILIQQKILVINGPIIHAILKLKYYDFFYPEIQTFLEKENVVGSSKSKLIKEYKSFYMKICQIFSKGFPDDFYEKRKIGENDDYICKIIREDSIEEFITFVKKNDYPLNSHISYSTYETNLLLAKNQPTLIEYASFFGSAQIFKYLFLNNVELTFSLWIYGIHSDNPEIISLLEENKIKPNEKCIKESIKCHHNDITNYILSNYFNEKNENQNFNENIIQYSFHYYNYTLFPNEFQDKSIFYYLCKYDYFTLVKLYLENKRINLRKKIIIFLTSSIKF